MRQSMVLGCAAPHAKQPQSIQHNLAHISCNHHARTCGEVGLTATSILSGRVRSHWQEDVVLRDITGDIAEQVLKTCVAAFKIATSLRRMDRLAARNTCALRCSLDALSLSRSLSRRRKHRPEVRIGAQGLDLARIRFKGRGFSCGCSCGEAECGGSLLVKTRSSGTDFHPNPCIGRHFRNRFPHDGLRAALWRPPVDLLRAPNTTAPRPFSSHRCLVQAWWHDWRGRKISRLQSVDGMCAR